MNMNEFSQQRDVVALEAFALTTNLSQLINKVFPGIVSSFTELSGGVPADMPAIALSSEERSFIKVIEQHKYVDLAPLRAHSPEGMKSTYLDYANSLAAVANYLEDTTQRLSRFSTYVSTLLMNADEAKDTRNFAKVYREMENTREDLLKEMAQHFEQSSHKTETSYGKVVARNADWPLLFDQLEKINTKLNKIDRKGLNNKSREISDLLEIFIKRFRTEGEVGQISGEVVSNVADGAYQMANELQFFAVTYYRLTALNAAVKDTMEFVKKTVK